MLPGGFHHRDFKRSEGVPGWVKWLTASGALVALGAIAGVLLASSLLPQIAWAVTAVVAAATAGLVWLYHSTSDRMDLPLHRHGQAKEDAKGSEPLNSAP